jgi:DNA invertase Pin-like site-specific DNA recombinase
MKAALSRKIDTILVYKLDRWGRSVVNLVTSIEQLTAAGVRFIATTQGLDTDKSNPTSALLLHILAAVAQFERELIKERVAAGMKKAQTTGTKSGKPIGRPTRILDRQAVRDRRAQGATYTELMNQFNLGRGHVQRILSG